MPTRIQLRRDTAANWTAANPVLADGEQALETDTGALKIGDGVTAWNDLLYRDNRYAPAAHVGSRDGHPLATDTLNGLMAGEDKARLDGLGPLTKIEAQPAAVYTLGSGAYGKILYDAEIKDDLGEYDPTLSRFTAARPGRYLINAIVAFQSNATGQRVAQVYKNGTISQRSNSVQAVSTDATFNGLTVPVDLLAGDYIEIFGYQDSGATLNVIKGYTWLLVTELR